MPLYKAASGRRTQRRSGRADPVRKSGGHPTALVLGEVTTDGVAQMASPEFGVEAHQVQPSSAVVSPRPLSDTARTKVFPSLVAAMKCWFLEKS